MLHYSGSAVVGSNFTLPGSTSHLLFTSQRAGERASLQLSPALSSCICLFGEESSRSKYQHITCAPCEGCVREVNQYSKYHFYLCLLKYILTTLKSLVHTFSYIIISNLNKVSLRPYYRDIYITVVRVETVSTLTTVIYISRYTNLMLYRVNLNISSTDTRNKYDQSTKII